MEEDAQRQCKLRCRMLSQGVKFFGYSHVKDYTFGQEKVHSALRSWRFPESPLPPSIAAGLATMEGGSAFLLRRHSSWQESVRELFLKLRCKACTAFYCIAPEVRRYPNPVDEVMKCGFISLPTFSYHLLNPVSAIILVLIGSAAPSSPGSYV